MSSNQSRPKWWQLYLVFPILIALFAMDARLQLPNIGHQVVQIGSVLLIYGLIHAWLKVNARALSAMNQTQLDGKIRVIKIQPYAMTVMDTKYEMHPLFQLPDSEIKGTLSDTFEMDIVNASFISVMNETHRN